MEISQSSNEKENIYNKSTNQDFFWIKTEKQIPIKTKCWQHFVTLL